MLNNLSKRGCAAVVFTALAVGVFWFMHRPSVHPEFGLISETSMAEHPGVWQQAQSYARKVFGLATPGGMGLLLIGPAPLEWSAGGGVGQGFIYANHPLLNNTPLWEFALSARPRLAEVHRSDLPSDYYGMNDPRGASAFGANWRGHALRVPEGQVFFARLVTNRPVVFVIRLAKQGAGRTRGQVQVEYVTVTNRTPNL